MVDHKSDHASSVLTPQNPIFFSDKIKSALAHVRPNNGVATMGPHARACINPLNTENGTPPARACDTRSPTSLLISDEIATLTNLKRGSLRTAKALLKAQSKELITLAGIRMASCAEELHRDHRGALRASVRCKRKTCAHCAMIRGAQATNALNRALNKLPTMKDENNGARPSSALMKAIKVTLNTGEACALTDLDKRLDVLHLAWRRLMLSKAFTQWSPSTAEGVSYGSMRSTEITPSENERANPHIHGFILIRIDEPTRDAVSAIHRKWPSILRRAYRSLGLLAPSLKTSVIAVEELTSQTRADLLSWATYCTKGSFNLDKTEHRASHERASVTYWQAVEEITHRRRLISFGGMLREEISIVKAELKEERAEQRAITPPIYETEFSWCDDVGEYVHPEKVSANPYRLTHAISYAEVHPHLSLIFQTERQIDPLKASQKSKDRALRLLANNGLKTMQLSNKETNNSYITQERHWSEPSEVIRALPSSQPKPIHDAKSAPQTTESSPLHDGTKSTPQTTEPSPIHDGTKSAPQTTKPSPIHDGTKSAPPS